ncbi:hypothetical protein SAMD00019534_021280 [Acytostelium subglobosum LB1]|uniref:hypothetical protein n=1 Tax=Acytostelium subglobosum LB1 TaxID=1410327 RepID=UPI000644B637|nr:hypothetical protein SAMD00019534_021280 [Acytostelium subglobosum LB1]GAM18953.1 hypothetical protein SAMD00019534_021280 [Acytostelium subglobosum LB1]|eukprot:XP_012758173.1 hypothetical protein SAMD00019534_021280 [Acytostelium subglobosum LB1]
MNLYLHKEISDDLYSKSNSSAQKKNNSNNNSNNNNKDNNNKDNNMQEIVVASPSQDYDTMPLHLFNNAASITKVDLSYNNITRIENIESLTKLTSLVLDNNQVGNSNSFPYLPTLKTLSLNNNNIDDLKAFIESIKDKFPNLTHLSLLKNPACPNYYFTGTDFGDYQKYRYYILSNLKHLKFLDFTEATVEEKKEAARLGHYSLTARPTAQDIVKDEDEDDQDNFRALPQELTEEGKGKAGFSVSNYVYYGRQSEGNRFIMNDDL